MGPRGPVDHRRHRRPRSRIRRWLLAGAAVTVAGTAIYGITLAAGEEGTTTAVVRAAEDTYVIRELPAAVSGRAVKVTAANWPRWHTEAYVKFAVPAPPKGQVVRSVTLQLSYERRDHQAAQTDLRPTAGDWSENTMTYRNRPAAGDVIARGKLTAPGAASLSFDVSRQVRAAGSYAFALTNPTANSVTSAYSREHGTDGPRLVIAYQPGSSPAPPSTSPSASPRPTASPTGASPSASPSPTGTQPTVPVLGTMCGAAFATERAGETYQQALSRIDGYYNGLETARVYYPGRPNPWPGKLNTGDRPVVVSFKILPTEVLSGTQDSYLRQWFADAPRGRDTYWVYWHEPEDDIRDGRFAAVDYRSAWQHLRKLADQSGNPRLKATLTLMGYSVVPASKRNWRDYYAGRDVVQAIAWDEYNYVNEGTGGYRDPAVLFSRLVQVTRDEGLPFAVAETGSALVPGDDGRGRAAWLRSLVRYLGEQRAAFVSYFDIDCYCNHGHQDYRLRDAHSQGAWREFCS